MKVSVDAQAPGERSEEKGQRRRANAGALRRTVRIARDSTVERYE